jgi:hypothetical protein
VLDIGESDFQSNPQHYAEILAAIQETVSSGVVRKKIGA